MKYPWNARLISRDQKERMSNLASIMCSVSGSGRFSAVKMYSLTSSDLLSLCNSSWYFL